MKRRAKTPGAKKVLKLKLRRVARLRRTFWLVVQRILSLEESLGEAKIKYDELLERADQLGVKLPRTVMTNPAAQ